MTTCALLTDSWSTVQKLVEDLRGSVLQVYCASEDDAAGLRLELVRSSAHREATAKASYTLQKTAQATSGGSHEINQAQLSTNQQEPAHLRLTTHKRNHQEQPLHGLTQAVPDQNKPEGSQAEALGQHQTSLSLSQAASVTAIQHAGQHQALQQQRTSMREAAQLYKDQQSAQAAELPLGAVALSSRPLAAANLMHDAHAQVPQPMAQQPTTLSQPNVLQTPQQAASQTLPSQAGAQDQLPLSTAHSSQAPSQPVHAGPTAEASQLQQQQTHEPLSSAAPAAKQAESNLETRQNAADQAPARPALQPSSEVVLRRSRKKLVAKKRKTWFEDSELPTAKQAIDWLLITAKAPHEAPQDNLRNEDRRKDLIKFAMAAKLDV